MIVKEVITPKVSISITIRIVIMVREMEGLGLRKLVIIVVKKNIEPLSVLVIVKRLEDVEKMFCLVKKWLKQLMNPRMVKT